jgi:PAS domain S-box-containing protein
MDAGTHLLLDLFADVPHVMVCIKDADGRYVDVNTAFVRRAGCRSAAQVVGRRAADLFAADLASAYDAQDRAVLVTGRELRNHLEPIEDRSGVRRWYLTSKVRHQVDDGSPIIVVVSVEAHLDGDRASGVRAAVEFAQERCTGPVRVADLAGVAGMSTDRLERAMQRALGVSPKHYLVRLRADAAARLLATTDRPIARIAVDCGYYDQSQLTRQFRSLVGMSPSEYRANARR